jgi:ATP phosphoribosyltransferase
VENLNIALPKGRLSKDTFQLLEKAGYTLPDVSQGRKLVLEDTINNFTYYFVKPSDVPTYVQEGVCDIGIVGMDTLLESSATVFELLDLKIGTCKMVLAGQDATVLDKPEVLRIATNFPKIAKTFFKKVNRKVTIVKLNGSVELGPIVGLSDAIVDIYETGSTLKANGLSVFDDIVPISAYLIAGEASYSIKNSAIKNVLYRLKEVV